MNRNKIEKIFETVRRINQIYELWADKFGLTLYELEIYCEIIENNSHSITQRELCEKLDAPKTSINSIIKKQLKTNRIKMEINQQNKREKIISLTPEGVEFASRVVCPLFEFEDEVMQQINEQDFENAVITQNKFAELLLNKIEDNNG